MPLEAGRELPELGEGEETPGFEGEELVPLLEDSPEAFEEEPELLSFLSPELVLSLEFSLPGLEEEFFSLEAPEPVSYTHLDVYKRQVFGWLWASGSLVGSFS